jgi:hypothetical protein
LKRWNNEEKRGKREKRRRRRRDTAASSCRGARQAGTPLEQGTAHELEPKEKEQFRRKELGIEGRKETKRIQHAHTAASCSGSTRPMKIGDERSGWTTVGKKRMETKQPCH